MKKLNKSTRTNYNLSFGFPGLLTILTILFICLKVFGVISWSWWLVLLPAFIGIGLGAIIMLFVLLVIFMGLLVGVILEVIE